MTKKIILLAGLVLLVGFGVFSLVNFIRANGIPVKYNIENWTGNLVDNGDNSVSVTNEETLGGFESGKLQFSNLGEGVLQSVRVEISSASFAALDTSSILLLASSSNAGGTAGAKVNQFIGLTIESNPSSEGYDNFRGFQVYVNDQALQSIVASAGPFVALGSGSNQRVQHIPASTCVVPGTAGTPALCDNAGAFRNVASASGFYLRQSDGNRSTIRTQGDTSFTATVYYRTYETH